MEAIASFAMLALFILAGSRAAVLAKRYFDGADLRRESLETLTGLCASHGLTPDERRAVTSVVEGRLNRQA